MIYIFYCTSRNRLNSESFNYFLKKLPMPVRADILKFKKWEDRQRSLFSKLLLTDGLNTIGENSYSLEQIKLTKYKRPYFDDDIDFNITHSGEYVVCAISFNHKIGIDIEEIKEIPLSDFENEFSSDEMKAIMNSENSMNAFYSLWTQKEAFLKAIGTGLYVPLHQIRIDDKVVKWNKQEWFLTKIVVDHKYVSHLCTNVLHPEISIQKIDFSKSPMLS